MFSAIKRTDIGTKALFPFVQNSENGKCLKTSQINIEHGGKWLFKSQYSRELNKTFVQLGSASKAHQQMAQGTIS